MSQSSGGVHGNHSSWGPAVSADGRFVAFRSSADNLVPVDTNATVDVFVRDRQSNSTELISFGSSGAQGDGSSFSPALSADGRFVAFWSHATNLVPADANGPAADVFVRDRQSGVIELVSRTSAGVQSNGQSYTGSISPSGRYVVFTSNADNLTPSDTNGCLDVFLRDRQNGTTEVVSLSSAGVLADDNCYVPVISADGRYVAFQSAATNLVAGDENWSDDIFVRDRQSGTMELVSVSSAGIHADFGGSYPSISADGRYVAFESAATNLVPFENGYYDIFLRDRQTGTTKLVNLSASGSQGNSSSRYPSMSADGRCVGFASVASNLVPGDLNDAYDVFVRNLLTGTTDLMSQSTAGAQGNDGSLPPSLSADGRSVAFESSASNLVPADGNGAADIFVRDRGAPATPAVYCLAKTNSLDCTPAIGFSGVPSASAGSGFFVRASSVLNNKAGLLFYSTTGSTLVPFQGGFLCTQAPLKRTAIQNSNGNPPPNDCSGTFSIDFNASIASGTDPALIAGQEVWAQYWSRDPGFAPPENTSLTDAVVFVIGP